MSRAFVREQDGDLPEDLPERPVSPHPNLVTARGLRLIEERIRESETARDSARQAEDNAAAAAAARDLRYWMQRKAGARVIEPEARPDKVRFGVRATLVRQDGSRFSFKLVGEDEADPASGLISWVSPVAQALLGHEVGDLIQLQGQEVEIVELTTG